MVRKQAKNWRLKTRAKNNFKIITRNNIRELDCTRIHSWQQRTLFKSNTHQFSDEKKN